MNKTALDFSLLSTPSVPFTLKVWDDEGPSMITAVFVAFLAVAMSCLVQRTRRGLNTGKDKQKYLLPPIAPYSFLDSLRAATSGNIAWFLRQVCGEMGHLCRLRFLIPGSIVYVSSDADVNREILTDPTTKKSPKLKNFNQITAGVSNFFTSNGYRFYHARKAMAPAFANNHIKRMDQVTIAKTEEWIQHRLEELVKSGQPVDINKEMVDLTLAVILEAAFEYDMSEKEQEELMTCVHVTLTTFVFPNPFKMWFWFLFPSIWEAHRKAREMMQIAKNIIEAYKHNRSPTKGTVIDLIMSNPNYNNDDERAADVVDLIIAGHETSANSMTFLLLELAKNPKEQSRLQQELQGMDPEDRKKSEHLKNCIKEGMRIWPVSAPGPIRVAGRDYIVPISTHDSSSSKHGDAQNDFVIPQGSLVFMPMISLAHNPRYFDDPLTFMPSRWESPTEAMKKAFMPFSTGKRNCLGQSLANSEMQFILSRLCVQYNFEVVEEGTTGYFITLKPVGTLLKATRI